MQIPPSCRGKQQCPSQEARSRPCTDLRPNSRGRGEPPSLPFLPSSPGILRPAAPSRARAALQAGRKGARAKLGGRPARCISRFAPCCPARPSPFPLRLTVPGVGRSRACRSRRSPGAPRASCSCRWPAPSCSGHRGQSSSGARCPRRCQGSIFLLVPAAVSALVLLALVALLVRHRRGRRRRRKRSGSQQEAGGGCCCFPRCCSHDHTTAGSKRGLVQPHCQEAAEERASKQARLWLFSPPPA